MQPLAGRRLWFVGIGGAGMSALAVGGERLGRRGRRLGPRGARLRRAARAAGRPGDDRPRGRERPARVGGGRVVGDRRPRTPSWRGGFRRRGELLAELVALRPSIVVAGAHGKTTTAAMIAFVARPARARPDLPDRRRRPPARRERAGAGAGVARRGGRRVRPLARAARAADRRRHERRPRPPRDLRLAAPRWRRSSTDWLAGLPAGSRRRPRRGASSRHGARARGAGRAQPPQRGLRARRARGGGRRRRRGTRRACGSSAALAGASSRAARRAGSASSTTTATIPPSSPRRWRRLVRARRRGPGHRPLPAAPLLAHAPPRPRARGRARRRRRRLRHRGYCGAGGAGPGCHGQARRRRRRELRPGMPVAWAPARRRRGRRRGARPRRATRGDASAPATSTAPSADPERLGRR